MTIGERIKYFREKQGITQAALADLTGIHPVSIRKYETNKMTPQDSQIDRIADALNINAIALTGVDISKMHFDTVGDVMGVLMLLLSTGVLEITWKESSGPGIDIESVEIKPNLVFSSFLELSPTGNKNKEKPLDAFIIKITHNPMIGDLVSWYINRNSYYEELSKATGKDFENPMSDLNRYKSLKEHQENLFLSDMLPLEEFLKEGLEINAAEKENIIEEAK